MIRSRKACEAVVVGGAAGFERLLRVTVLEIKGTRVRLGFDPAVARAVHRWEETCVGHQLSDVRGSAEILPLLAPAPMSTLSH